MKIPKASIHEGIRLSIENSEQYVRDSRLLIDNGSNSHMVVMAIFACEELGKAGYLADCIMKQKEKTEIEVNPKIFTSHEFKIDYARQLGVTLIIESSRLGYAKLPFRLGAHEVIASPQLRLDCAFVGFEDNNWKLGMDCDPNMIKNLLEDVEAHLVHLRKRFL